MTGAAIHHFEFGRNNGTLFLHPTRMIPLPSQNLSNVYSCLLHDKLIYISNLPNCHDDFSKDSRIFVYNAGVEIKEADTQEEIVEKTLKVIGVELIDDDTDA